MSETPEMVERVARAMAAAEGFDGDSDRVAKVYAPLARAAIEAMRVPTFAMAKAGDLPGWGGDVSVGLSSEVWQAMIDAALTQPT